MLDYNMEENAGLVNLLENMVKDQIVNVTCHAEKTNQEFAVVHGDKIFSKLLRPPQCPLFINHLLENLKWVVSKTPEIEI